MRPWAFFLDLEAISNNWSVEKIGWTALSLLYGVIGYTSAPTMASSRAIQDRCICHNVDEPQWHA
jgi:hypothetical protein